MKRWDEDEGKRRKTQQVYTAVILRLNFIFSRKPINVFSQGSLQKA